MPRVSKIKCDSNRLAITEASARLFRERGVSAVSVSDLMAEAGLTHGGFYGHFASKDALAAEACSLAFNQAAERWSARARDASEHAAARATLIRGYLSSSSRDNPGKSCPATGMVGDVAREAAGAPLKAAFVAGLSSLLDVLVTLNDGRVDGAARQAALTDLSTMVGGLLLARATAGTPVSDEFLTACRERLCEPARRSRN